MNGKKLLAILVLITAAGCQHAPSLSAGPLMSVGISAKSETSQPKKFYQYWSSYTEYIHSVRAEEFYALDKNKDGLLSDQELGPQFSGLKLGDRNRDGSLSKLEYFSGYELSFIPNKQFFTMIKEGAKRDFPIADKNADGFVDKAEYLAKYTAPGMPAYHYMFDMADGNNDKKLNLAELEVVKLIHLLTHKKWDPWVSETPPR